MTTLDSKKYRLKKNKIKSIKKIGVRKCYDLSVPNNHNFFLAMGVLVHNCFAVQNYDSMPEDIRSNTKYVFLPRSAKVEDIKNALNDTGMSRNIQSAVNDAIKLKKRMGREPFSWLVIDKMNSKMDIITFSAPLSNHMETSN